MKTIAFKGSPTSMGYEDLFGFEWVSDDTIVIKINGEYTEYTVSKDYFISMVIDALAWVDGRWDREEREANP